MAVVWCMVLYIYRYIQYIVVFPWFIAHTAWPCLHYNSRICIVLLCLCTSGNHFSLRLLHPSLGHLSFWRSRGEQGRCYVQICYSYFIFVLHHIHSYLAWFMICVYCCGKVIYQSIYVCNHQPIIPLSHQSNNSSIHPSTIDSPSCQSIHPSIHYNSCV